MPATQISFADFALSAQQAATPSTPPVHEAALAVVAHPLAVDGGECNLVFEGSCSPWRGMGYGDLRDDYGFKCDFVAGCGMDAPDWLPSGSHAGVNVHGRSVVAAAVRCLRAL